MSEPSIDLKEQIKLAIIKINDEASTNNIIARQTLGNVTAQRYYMGREEGLFRAVKILKAIMEQHDVL